MARRPTKKGAAREINLGNGKGPKHTGRSEITLIPTASVSTIFFQKLNYLCPAFHTRRHPTAHNRLRTRRHLDQIPLFHRLSNPSLKWPGCEKKFGEKFGENRGQDHCNRSQIPKCFYSTNCQDPRHQHTRSGKANSPTQASQAPPPHRSGQGRKLASFGMKILLTQIRRGRKQGPSPLQMAPLRRLFHLKSVSGKQMLESTTSGLFRSGVKSG
jgi:hypothetical protein